MALSDYDKQVREAGYNYIPRTEFLLNPFKIPESKPIVDTETGGIPTLIPRDSGDGFNPYNTDMSTIRQDFNPYEARQAEEIYSRTFNPGPNPYATSMYGDSLPRAQSQYNLANQNISLTGPMTPERRAEIMRTTDDIIQDNRMKYATEGQYVDPYDPRYSSMTEAQKFMDNYPEYYGVPSGVPETGIPAAIRRYMQDSLIGKGLGAAKGFVENVLPFNERAVLEDQARAAGIFTDDIGRIVTDDYNTAGGIMAGYNLNKIDADTFQKRRDTINAKMSDRINPETGKTFKQERLDLLDEAEAQILGARKKTKLVSKLRKDKKVADKKRKEEEEAAAAAAAAAAAEAAAEKSAMERVREQQAIDEAAYRNQPGQYGGDNRQQEREQAGPGYSGSGTAAEMGSFARGGRVYYMDGGLADLVDIYD